MTNNLNRTPVAANQGSTVFDAIENSTGACDAKLTETLTVTSSSTTPSLTAAQMRGNACFLLNGSPAGAVTLSVAAVEIGRFTIINTCGQTVTVQISGQAATAPTVANGAAQTFVSDGVNVRAAVSAASGAQSFELEVAASDEATSLTTGTAKVTFYAPMNASISEVFIGVTAQSTSGAVTADLNKNGTTMFSTNPSIDANEDTSLTGTAAVLSVTTWTKGDKMTIDIDAAGTGAKGLKMIIRGTRS